MISVSGRSRFRPSCRWCCLPAVAHQDHAGLIHPFNQADPSCGADSTPSARAVSLARPVVPAGRISVAAPAAKLFGTRSRNPRRSAVRGRFQVTCRLQPVRPCIASTYRSNLPRAGQMDQIGARQPRPGRFSDPAHVHRVSPARSCRDGRRPLQAREPRRSRRPAVSSRMVTGKPQTVSEIRTTSPYRNQRARLPPCGICPAQAGLCNTSSGPTIGCVATSESGLCSWPRLITVCTFNYSGTGASAGAQLGGRLS